MPAFLSPEWIAAVDAAADDPRIRSAVQGLTLVVQQHVLDTPDGDVDYHVVVDAGEVHVRPGIADEPTVSFTQDYETAAAISRGDESAQSAFMTGRLRLGGDVGALLLNQEALAAMADVFAGVRAETTFESVASGG